MNQHALPKIVGFFMVCLLLFSSFYVIKENEKGILLSLGEIVTDKAGDAVVKSPGLHMKIPLLQQVRIFDVRLQTKEVDDARFTTKLKKDVIVNYFVKWHITNLSRYLISTSGNLLKAESLLEQQINDNLRTAFAKHTMQEMIAGKPADILQRVQQQTNQQTKTLGMTVVDVRIKRMDLPVEVSHAVYLQMAEAAKKKAEGYRAKGRADAEKIRTIAETKAAWIVAEAKKKAEILRGEGEAAAAMLYAEVYGKDPDFYAFLSRLDAYRNSFTHKQDILILQPDTSFFKYFKTPSPVTDMANSERRKS